MSLQHVQAPALQNIGISATNGVGFLVQAELTGTFNDLELHTFPARGKVRLQTSRRQRLPHTPPPDGLARVRQDQNLPWDFGWARCSDFMPAPASRHDKYYVM